MKLPFIIGFLAIFMTPSLPVKSQTYLNYNQPYVNPPDGEKNLINIDNQMTIPESLRLLEKVKKGKKNSKIF